jgi:predicted transcriptional regulator
MEDSRWEDTLKALGSLKTGKFFDESEVVSWIKSWGSENELSPPTK